MKNKIILASIFFFSLLYSCKKDSLPANPTLSSPISGLVVSVAGYKCKASAALKTIDTLSDTLYLAVKKLNDTAIVQQISLADSVSTSASIKAGSILTFTNSISPVTLTSNGTSHTYYVKMVYTPPPFMYFIKTSDKDASGGRYFLNTATAQTIASNNYDENFEGYIDLTSTSWDNIGLIQSDKSAYFDFNGGWWPQQSSGSFTLTKEAPAGSGYYPCAGPWADWNWVNSNAAIISPGVWKLNYNTSTKILNLVETQFAVSGSATSTVQAMNYSSTTKRWTLTTNLTVGNLKFTTIAVTKGDPVVTLGEYNDSGNTGNLATDGNNIIIPSAGSYTITLNLSAPPYYTYSIVKN
jgi:hypothetical protein